VRGRGTTPALTWCTLGRAAKLATAGDTVHVLAADYRETVRFYTSGTQAAPIRIVAAEPGVVVDAAGAGQALKLMDVSDVEISGLRVTGAIAQGVWVQGGARVRLVDLDASPAQPARRELLQARGRLPGRRHAERLLSGTRSQT
jgi:hypothetical protein